MSINWIKLSESQPPIGEYVLAYGGDKQYPLMRTDRLNFGGKYECGGQDPTLLYWDSGFDYDEVTHWAYLPNLPDVTET